MTIPLIILAACAVLLGFLGTPAWPWLQSFLDDTPFAFSFGAFFAPGLLTVMLTSSAIVLLGLAVGWWFYGRKPIERADSSDPIEQLQPSIFSTLSHALYVDALYSATILRWNAFFSAVCAWLDRWVWNGAVQTFSYLVIVLAHVDNFFDTGLVNPGFDEGCETVSRGGKLFSLLQGGRVQSYLRIIGGALVVLTILLLWGARA
jgi:NADH-quinone oxidoreductase subunit L